MIYAKYVPIYIGFNPVSKHINRLNPNATTAEEACIKTLQ